MKDLDALVTPSKKIKLGGITFIIEDIKIGRAIKLLNMYNSATAMVSQSGKKIMDDEKYALKYLNKMINLCLEIVRPAWTIKWVKLFGISRRWFYRNTNQDQLTAFVSEVIGKLIEPGKKKVEGTLTE